MVNVFLFPGQGSQKAGMYSFVEPYASEVNEIFELAEEVTCRDIKYLCQEATDEELKQTTNAQIAITTMNMVYLKLLENRGVQPDIIAGHSLGQLSALVAADVISLCDLFRLVQKRAELMSEIAESGKLATIVGLDREVVSDVCKKVSESHGLVKIALENSRQQFVIGGKENDVDAAVAAIKEKKPLKIQEIMVSNAFHTYLMAPMVERFTRFVNSLEFHEPTKKILLNCKGGYGENAEEIRRDVVMQCENTVKWMDCMNVMLEVPGISIAEVGIGHVCRSMLKGMDRSHKVYCMSNAEDFEKYISYNT